MAAKSTPSKSSKGERSGFGAPPSEPKGQAKALKPSAGQSRSVRSPQRFAKSRAQSSQGIPEIVSKRMAKRMAVLCGVPTLLGLSTFPLSYFVAFQNGIELPNVAVLLTSLGCLGLGVLGLSYGVLSASWDEGLPGSRLGLKEFRLNCGRLVENWKAGRDHQNS